MRKGAIIIESPGMFTTVQDFGRVGFQRFGMPVSGAMDTFSHGLANILVNNLQDAATLEATITGPEIRFPQDTSIAICGAGMAPYINGSEMPLYQAIAVRENDLLAFKGTEYGCRCYIAFAGGIDVDRVLGSRSTYIRLGLGGWEGRALRKGDTIPLGEKTKDHKGRKIPMSLRVDYAAERPVRILPGPEIKRLDIEALCNILNAVFMISHNSDRMGYRLEGDPVLLKEPAHHEIISSGLTLGTIQLPGNDQPVILMADHQTTGGYARVAVVAAIDHTMLAQKRPGDTISFCEIKLEEAHRLFVERQRLLNNLF